MKRDCKSGYEGGCSCSARNAERYADSDYTSEPDGHSREQRRTSIRFPPSMGETSDGPRQGFPRIAGEMSEGQRGRAGDARSRAERTSPSIRQTSTRIVERVRLQR